VNVPKTKRIDVSIQLRLTPGTSLDDVRPQVEAAVRGYIDNLRVADGNGGSDLILNELISRVQDASSAIIDSAVSLSVDGTPGILSNVIAAPGERLVSHVVTIA
jgi:uncharacterized phage protein gp47/JayE